MEAPASYGATRGCCRECLTGPKTIISRSRTPTRTYTYATRGADSGDNQRSRASETNGLDANAKSGPRHRNAGSMGLRPTQPIGTKDAKQTAEIYARISQETFDQVCWGRR